VKKLVLVSLFVLMACGETTTPNKKNGNKANPVDVKKNGNGSGLVTKTPDPKTEEPAIKSIPSIDLSVLPGDRKQAYLEALNDEISPCDRPETLAACAASKQSCLECGYSARTLFRLIRDSEGTPEKSKLSEFLGQFKDALTAKPVTGFDLTGVPTKGSGPIVVIEYADFQCGHCAEMHKTLKNVLPAYMDKITFHYKNFPLPSHTLAEPAARASLAAGRQNKFWEMHAIIFERQGEIKAESFEIWAKELGLDAAKFKADFEDPALAAQVARDLKEAQTFGLQGTPSIFIDGRVYSDSLTMDAVKDAFEFAIAKRAQPQ
jgi:protein-disulfide isomerase